MAAGVGRVRPGRPDDVGPRQFLVALGVLALLGGTTANAQGRGRGRGREDHQNPPGQQVSQQEQQRRIAEEQQRQAEYQRTLDALTNAVTLQFAYDPAGRLLSVTDVDDKVTTVERDATGRPTAIAGPYGQRTSLALDQNGYLASGADPAVETTELTTTSDGLLTSLTEPRGGVHRFGYDSDGHLVRDEDASGMAQTFSRTARVTPVTGPDGAVSLDINQLFPAALQLGLFEVQVSGSGGRKATTTFIVIPILP